jgi:hypothetical protein
MKATYPKNNKDTRSKRKLLSGFVAYEKIWIITVINEIIAAP